MSKFIKAFPVLLLALIMAACGGSGGGGNTTSSGSPADAAKGFMDAMAALDATKMKNFLCAAQAAGADGMTEAFNQAGTQAKLDTSGLTYTATESGDTATVTMSGNMKVEVAGQSVDTDITTMFPEGKLPLVKENGAWKVCPAA